MANVRDNSHCGLITYIHDSFKSEEVHINQITTSWEHLTVEVSLVIQRILLLMFKHNIGIVPKPIASLFTKKSEIHNYNTRHCSSLHPAIGKSEATYRTFSYHAILIWNYLSKLICTNVTLACFKKRSLVYLQTHLISYRTVR